MLSVAWAVGMPLRAMGRSGIFSDETRAAPEIHPQRYRFKVAWTHAPSVSASVVYCETIRYLTVHQLIRIAVNVNSLIPEAVAGVAT